jgi:hypothetical protein
MEPRVRIEYGPKASAKHVDSTVLCEPDWPAFLPCIGDRLSMYNDGFDTLWHFECTGREWDFHAEGGVKLRITIDLVT